VLRPLRSLQRIKRLKMLITAIFDAIPTVIDNLLLFAFILILFAITGVLLFMGELTYRCYITDFPERAPYTDLSPSVNMTMLLANATYADEVLSQAPGVWLGNVSGASLNASHLYVDPRYTNLSTPFLVRNDDRICGGGHRCDNLTDPYGVPTACESHPEVFRQRNLHFDHLVSSGLITLKIMVLDDWNEDLSDIMDATSRWSALVFVVLTFVGSFICVNLFLAILTRSYHSRSEDFELVDAGTQVEEEHIDNPDDYADDDNGVPQRKPASRRPSNSAAGAGDVAVNVLLAPPDAASPAAAIPDSSPAAFELAILAASAATPDNLAASPPAIEMTAPDSDGAASSVLTSDNLAIATTPRRPGHLSHNNATPAEVGMAPQESLVASHLNATLPPPPASGSGSHTHSRRGSATSRLSQKPVTVEDLIEMEASLEAKADFNMNWDKTPSEIAAEEEDDRAPWRRKLELLLESFPLQLFLAVVTLINVATLAIDWHGIDPKILEIMDIVNFICTGIYAVFLTATVVAFGFQRTFLGASAGYNWLDLIVILFVIPEVFAPEASGYGLNVLRVFRLVRLLRFLRIRSLQPLIRTIADSVSSIAWLSLLIVLFLYVFRSWACRSSGRATARVTRAISSCATASAPFGSRPSCRLS